MQKSPLTPLATTSLAAAVSAPHASDPIPVGRRNRYVLIFNPDTLEFVERRKRRYVLRDVRRGTTTLDEVLNVGWFPAPREVNPQELREALIQRYPYFAAFCQLGLQAGLEAASDAVAQSALWMEEIARAIRYRLNLGMSISEATGEPVAGIVPPEIQEALQDFLGQLAPMLQHKGLAGNHPVNTRERSLATALGINPDEPGWTDALPWTPVRQAARGRTIDDMARNYGITEPHQVLYLTAIARAVLDSEAITLSTPLDGYAYARVDVVMRLVLHPVAFPEEGPDVAARKTLEVIGPYIAG
jgi:hypothetical protein